MVLFVLCFGIDICVVSAFNARIHIFEPSHEKTNNLQLRTGRAQTDLCSHRRRIDA